LEFRDTSYDINECEDILAGYEVTKANICIVNQLYACRNMYARRRSNALNRRGKLLEAQRKLIHLTDVLTPTDALNKAHRDTSLS
jgi:hypothetical protein